MSIAVEVYLEEYLEINEKNAFFFLELLAIQKGAHVTLAL